MSTKSSSYFSSTPHQQEKREKLQKALLEFYQTDKGKQLKGKVLTQKELADYLHLTQPDISRRLKGHEIDWDSGKIVKTASKTDIVQLMKKVTITKPSIFFLSVPRNKRKRLKEALLQYFPSTESSCGIIHIIENTQPSGLIILSNDHNLEYHLNNNDYLQERMDNASNKNQQ